MLRLKRGRGERLRAGHLWVYQGEIADPPSADLEPGAAVDIADYGGRFLGRGYYNPVSQICVRLLTWKQEPLDKGFFARRLASAVAYRERFCPRSRAARLVYSEADLLPGLVVDRYDDCLAIQILTMGMEVRRSMLFDLLVECLHPRAIQERSEASVRAHEGLSARTGPVFGEIPDEILVEEDELIYLVDLSGGQKTGHFLDQRQNRLASAALARDRRVLDCFCHTGGFGIAAARAGAREVTGVDTDPDALALAGRMAALNHVQDRCRFVPDNAFDFLRRADEAGERYDQVILDPPAFTKSKLRVEQAMRGYKEINLRGIRLLNPGGILVTCSCSYHISPELFQEIVAAAAADAGRRLRLLQRRGQALDHPVLLGMPETEYLKCLILEATP